MKSFREGREFKGAVFDLDGTLLDSMGLWRSIDYAFLGKRGLPVTEEYLKAIVTLCFWDAAVYTIEKFGLADTPEMLIQEWKEMAREAYADRILLKPGVKEYLGKLKNDGIQIAAATSGEEALFLPCLSRNGIASYFDTIVTVKEVKRGKGFPDIYELAAKRLELTPKECVVFEDIYPGIMGAKAGDFAAVGILDDHSSCEWDKIRENADRTIVDFTELL